MVFFINLVSRKKHIMNYDDELTKSFEEKFQHNLKLIREIPPEAVNTLKAEMLVIKDWLDEFKQNPNPSTEDLQLLAVMGEKFKTLHQKLEDMQLILGESLRRQAMAFYENVKRLAKEGDPEAEKIYQDLSKHFKNFDTN